MIEQIFKVRKWDSARKRFHHGLKMPTILNVYSSKQVLNVLMRHKMTRSLVVISAHVCRV